jgi:hypothetical protein
MGETGVTARPWCSICEKPFSDCDGVAFLIDEWHKRGGRRGDGTAVTLAAWLGMTPEEYARFVEAR